MKKIFLITLSLLLAIVMAGAPADAKTTRKAKARKTATTRKSSSKVSVKTVINRLDKWSQESYNQSFEQKLTWSKAFMKNTVTPYIAGKYPSKTLLPDYDKCNLLYSDLTKYISNSNEIQSTNASMSFGASMLCCMNEATAYVQISAIEDCMADANSKQAWLAYASSLNNLREKISSIADDYTTCGMGGGSLMMVIGPSIYDTIIDGLKQMLIQDSQALSDNSFSASPADPAVSRFIDEINYSSLDSELIEYLSDETKQNVQNAKETIIPLVAECQRLHAAWVATLPANIQPLMKDNLGLLFKAATEAVTES